MGFFDRSSSRSAVDQSVTTTTRQTDNRIAAEGAVQRIDSAGGDVVIQSGDERVLDLLGTTIGQVGQLSAGAIRAVSEVSENARADLTNVKVPEQKSTMVVAGVVIALVAGIAFIATRS